MARKTTIVSTGKPVAAEVKLVPDPKLELPYPRLYANYVAVNSSPFDFTLRFCDALPLYERPKVRDGVMEVKIPIVAEIILPLNVFPDMIKAMQLHYDNRNEAYGEAVKDEKKV